MANLTAAYARMRAEANQPDPEDFDDEEEYEEACREYWGLVDEREADYYECMADAERDDAMLDW